MSKTSLPLYGPQGLFNLCTHQRRVQLPAQTFQLLARRTSSDPKYPVCRSSLRWLHTTHQNAQQSTIEINSVNRSNQAELVQDKKVQRRERERERERERKHHASVVDSQKPESSNTTESLKRRTGRKEGRPFEKPRGRHSFRDYMRRVCHPVAIVTSTDTNIDPEGGPKTWRGATVSSFNSVTIQPKPYVSFNIKKLSSTYDAIKHSSRFMVHVMSKTAEAAAIATHFSRGNGAEPFFLKPSPKTQVEQPEPEPKPHSFVQRTASWFNNQKESSLPPTIQWFSPPSGRGVLFHCLCEFKPGMSTEVGDHIIVIGKVIYTFGNLDAHTELEQHNLENVPQCLTYEDGKYLCEANPGAEKRWNLGLDPVDSRKDVRKSEREKSATEDDVKITKYSPYMVKHFADRMVV